MIIERSTAEHFEDWVRLRQALWPAETIDEHRRYAASVIDRSKDAIAYLAREQDGNIIAFAEATLRRDYVNGCSSSPVGFLEGLYVAAPYRGRGDNSKIPAYW
jgi:aminoglycoside 6'-N-acetyltransferase I